MTGELASRADAAAAEIGKACARIDQADMVALAGAIADAGRIVLHGVGREGLMMRALAMRLYHLGLDAHVAGDMSAPPLGPDDLLLVSAGPGRFETVEALVRVAREAGARTACVTAQPDGSTPRACDMVLTIPAQTMADDAGPSSGVGAADGVALRGWAVPGIRASGARSAGPPWRCARGHARPPYQPGISRCLTGPDVSRSRAAAPS